jgi:cytochrome c biogenesis protein
MVDDEGAPFRVALQEGATVQLPEGRGSITMDGWERWVKLQVGDSPGVPISLAAVAFAVLGLCLSLFVRPRRVWVRLTGSPGGGRLLEVGGLDRADARGGLTEDVDEIVDSLADASRGAPDPEFSPTAPPVRKQ